MKFVKENLAVVICAAVAVLLLVAAFVYPIPGWIGSLKEEMEQGMQPAALVKTDMNTPLALPLQGQTKEYKGIPSDALIEVKKEVNDAIAKQKSAVEGKGRTFNSEGRLSPSKQPLLPAPTAANPNGTIEATGFLPRMQPGAVALKFKADYISQFRMWTGWLVKGTPTDSEADITMPPTADMLLQMWEEKKRGAPPVPGTPAGGFAGSVARDQEEFAKFQKQQVMNKAAGIRMYVDRNAFQIRPFATLDNPPTEKEIFESLLDSWIQSDVVKAIVATNAQAGAGAAERNINSSPVKRLTRIMIGNNARNRFLALSSAGPAAAPVGASAADLGPQFLMSFNASATLGGHVSMPVAVDGSGAADAPMPENKIDYTLGMTGRSGGGEYDVVLMNLVIDLDPTKLNTFLDQLYQRNMGYTVSNMQMKTVDPLERASNGYLYGDGAVVEYEFLIECIFYRSWVHPLMPDKVREQYGLPAWKAPAAALAN